MCKIYYKITLIAVLLLTKTNKNMFLWIKLKLQNGRKLDYFIYYYIYFSLLLLPHSALHVYLDTFWIEMHKHTTQPHIQTSHNHM